MAGGEYAARRCRGSAAQVEQDEASACAGPGAVIGNRYAPEALVGDSGGRHRTGSKQWADGLQTAGAVGQREKRGSGRLNRPGRSTPQNTGGGPGAAWLDGLVREEHGAGVERRNGGGGW